MPLYSVFTNEYDANIVELLKRRLLKQQTDEGKRIAQRLAHCECKNECCACAWIEAADEMRAYCLALSDLMLFDLRYFEIADMAEKLPFDLETKRAITESALEYSKFCVGSAELADAIADCLKENNCLNLEGYIHFRLKDRMDVWRAAVDAAVDDSLAYREYTDLFGMLGLLSLFENGQSSLAVILNPDGSCTITNEAGHIGSESEKRIWIECAPGNNEGVLGMLRGMAPKCISVFDLSIGACEELKQRLLKLFPQK